MHGADHIDGKTIDGHVIPKQVLFTTPTKKDVPYQTLASGDNNLRVVITFFEETQGKSKISEAFFFILWCRWIFVLTSRHWHISRLSLWYWKIVCFCTAYVKSETILGDSKHSKGVVLAQIVRANFPVKNGVVHLIHKPLMVVDSTVKQLLEVSDQFL